MPFKYVTKTISDLFKACHIRQYITVSAFLFLSTPSPHWSLEIFIQQDKWLIDSHLSSDGCETNWKRTEPNDRTISQTMFFQYLWRPNMICAICTLFYGRHRFQKTFTLFSRIGETHTHTQNRKKRMVSKPVEKRNKLNQQCRCVTMPPTINVSQSKCVMKLCSVLWIESILNWLFIFIFSYVFNFDSYTVKRK